LDEEEAERAPMKKRGECGGVEEGEGGGVAEEAGGRLAGRAGEEAEEEEEGEGRRAAISSIRAGTAPYEWQRRR
jgi:hypothetical protein